MTNHLTIKVGPAIRGNVKISYVDCGHFTREAFTGESIYIPCVDNVKGRGVQVQTTDKTLVLCEVAIYGTQG